MHLKKKKHHYFLNENLKFSLHSAVQTFGLQFVQAFYLKKTHPGVVSEVSCRILY